MQKTIYVESIEQNVVLARRKGTRSMRLSLKSDGTLRLSIPYLVSEKQAIKFIDQKSDWISKHHKRPLVLNPNSHIGKSHRLYFENIDIDRIKTRLSTNSITLKLPIDIAWDSLIAQSSARKACEKALKKESETLLPQRLATLAQQNSIEYRSCSVKKLKSRWGSCDSLKNITLNIYLIQLDWRLIDYVILHELAHTHHQHHQLSFWEYLTSISPNCKSLRKELKSMPTDIYPT